MFCHLCFPSVDGRPSLSLVMPEVSSFYKSVLPSHSHQGLAQWGTFDCFFCVILYCLPCHVKHLEVTVGIWCCINKIDMENWIECSSHSLIKTCWHVTVEQGLPPSLFIPTDTVGYPHVIQLSPISNCVTLVALIIVTSEPILSACTCTSVHWLWVHKPLSHKRPQDA